MILIISVLSLLLHKSKHRYLLCKEISSRPLASLAILLTYTLLWTLQEPNHKDPSASNLARTSALMIYSPRPAPPKDSPTAVTCCEPPIELSHHQIPKSRSHSPILPHRQPGAARRRLL